MGLLGLNDLDLRTNYPDVVAAAERDSDEPTYEWSGAFVVEPVEDGTWLRIHACGTCGALVPTEMTGLHTHWHRALVSSTNTPPQRDEDS